MSKAFGQWYVDTEFNPMAYGAMQASWNAALEHAAKICRAQLIGTGKYDDPVDISYDKAVTDCAKAIRKEKTE